MAWHVVAIKIAQLIAVHLAVRSSYMRRNASRLRPTRAGCRFWRIAFLNHVAGLFSVHLAAQLRDMRRNASRLRSTPAVEHFHLSFCCR